MVNVARKPRKSEATKLAKAIVKSRTRIRRPEISAEDQIQIIKNKARLFDLVHRINTIGFHSSSKYFAVTANLVPGEEDWGCSSVPVGFNYQDTTSLVVTDRDGEKWSMSPGSQDWVFELIDTMLDQIDEEIREAREAADRRAKAVERARSKLSEEDFALLGLK